MIDRISVVLPQPDSPTSAMHLAAIERQVDAVDGADRRCATAELHVRIVDDDDRLAVGLDRRRLFGELSHRTA